MASDVRTCVVRVESLDGKYIAGTGFVATEDLAVTCAHVIDALNVKPGGQVRLTFQVGGAIEAGVLVNGWYPEKDVAFLQLSEPLPDGVAPAPLGQSDKMGGHIFSAFGYPEIADRTGQYDGVWARGEILGKVINTHKRTALQLRSQEVTSGMSGAPVLDVDTERVVGMVTETYIPDQTGKFRDAGFAIPVDILRDLAPTVIPLQLAPYSSGRFFDVPFMRNPDFVGREEYLEKIHQALMAEGAVGISPAGLTGMGGIGKTQLAIEYAYRYQWAYRGGVFWINATESLEQGFARLGRRVQPDLAAHSIGEQVRAAAHYLQEHPDSLLILDNLEDPVTLNRLVSMELVPAALPCRTLFTTRRRDLGRYRAVEIAVLPEDAALRLLLHHPLRQAILHPTHPEFAWARVICATVGYLPLALELAAAFLGQYPEISLYDYRLRLLREGAMNTVDDTELQPEEMPTRHEVAVRATLQTSWRALDDEDSRLILRVAGQLKEAELIPIVRLGLLSGLAPDAKTGYPAPLTRAIRKLITVSLIEELEEKRVRLHPLVREFAERLTSVGTERKAFREQLAENLLFALNGFAALEKHIAQRGVDDVLGDLKTALRLCAARTETRHSLWLLDHLLDQEAHHLRGWDADEKPGYFAQRVHARAVRLKAAEIQHESERQLPLRHVPNLKLLWRSGSEDPTLLRTLGECYANAVVVTPDSECIISANMDKTLKVWDLETGETRLILQGHSNAVSALALTSDGTRVISASRDKTLKVWDLATGHTLHTLQAHTGEVKAIALALNDAEVLSLSEDSTLRVWSLKNGKMLSVLDVHAAWHSVVVTPDGTQALSASKDNSLKLWDLRKAQVCHTFEGHTKTVRSLAITPDGMLAISASEDKTLKVWNLKTRKMRHTLEGHTSIVMAVAVTPDGTRALSASADRTIKVWNLTTGHLLRTLKGHTAEVYTLAVLPGGIQVVSASLDQTMKLWDLATGQVIHTFRGHTNSILAIAVTPNGKRVISASTDQTMKVWDLHISGSGINQVSEKHDRIVFAIAVTPDGRRVVSASFDTTLKVWDIATGQVQHTLDGHLKAIETVTLTPDGARAISGSRDKTIKVWDLDTGKLLCTLEGHTAGLEKVMVTPDGTIVVSGAQDNTLRVWHLGTGQMLFTLEGHKDSIQSIIITPDGKRAISASRDKTLRVWDIENGKLLCILKGHTAAVSAVTVTPDGTKAISASDDKTLRIWDLEREIVLQTLEGHTASVRTVLVTPDGKRIISASSDKTLKVWDLTTGRVLNTLAGHTQAIRAEAITPDGVYIVSASEDKTLRVWDLRTGREIASFEGDGQFLCVAATQQIECVRVFAGDVGGVVWAVELIE